jgi:hypothetical protein
LASIAPLSTLTLGEGQAFIACWRPAGWWRLPCASRSTTLRSSPAITTVSRDPARVAIVGLVYDIDREDIIAEIS